jgi:hypothetical protein
MQKRTVKDMEFDYNIAKEQLAIKEKLIQVRPAQVNLIFYMNTTYRIIKKP